MKKANLFIQNKRTTRISINSSLELKSFTFTVHRLAFLSSRKATEKNNISIMHHTFSSFRLCFSMWFLLPLLMLFFSYLIQFWIFHFYVLISYCTVLSSYDYNWEWIWHEPCVLSWICFFLQNKVFHFFFFASFWYCLFCSFMGYYEFFCYFWFFFET